MVNQSVSTSMDSFTYERDTFFVEVGGHNRHRRATVYEIQELLHPPFPQPNKDPTGHWYEAQCIHYGLRPSKTKSVAKTRLLDALNNKSLKVPEIIQQTETRLRKKWHKDAKEKVMSYRETPMLLNGENSNRKRKLTATLEESGPKRKKATIKKEEHQEGLKLHDVNQAPPDRPIQSARRGKMSTARVKSQNPAPARSEHNNVKININTSIAWPNAFQSEDGSDHPKRRIQTARCNRAGTVQKARARTNTRVANKRTQEDSQPQPQRRKQTARRSAPSIGRVRGNTTSSCRGDRSFNSQDSQQPATTSTGSCRSKQTARRSRGWRSRAGRAMGQNYSSSRSKSVQDGANSYKGHNSHEYFEYESYDNEEFSNEQYVDRGFSNDGYFDSGYSNENYPYAEYSNEVYCNDGYSNEGYLSDRYSNEGYSHEEYGSDISAPNGDDYTCF